MRAWCYCTLLVLGLVLMVGCSSSDQGVLLPDTNIPDDLELAGTTQEPLESNGPTVLWGYWEVHIDPLSGTVEIIPLRGVQWTVNLVTFMQPPGGPINSLSIDVIDTSEWLSDGHLPVDVTLTHPFPGLFQYTGADVRGVLITTGNNQLQHDSDLRCSDYGGSDPYLANSDGYTRWMNPVEFPDDGTIFTYTPGAMGTGSGFDARLNGYKYFTDNLGATDNLYEFFLNPTNLHNRGQFTPSSSNTRRYDLYFPLTGPGGLPDLVFQYAILASWVDPVDLDPGDLPGSFSPEANCQETFLVNVVDDSTLYYTEEQAGGDLVLNVEIFDWAPYLNESGSVLDEIHRIVIESPQGILPTAWVEYDSTTLAAIAQSGATGASSVVAIEIIDCLPIAVDGQQVVIAVEHSGDVGYDNYGAGTVYPDAELTSYYFYTLNVAATIPQVDEPVVTSVEPDHGITNTYIFDVAITGENLSGVTQLRIVGDTEETTFQNIQVIDDEHLMGELDMATLPVGFYDIIADDPVLGSGTLEDGFEVMECPTGIHTVADVYEVDTPYYAWYAASLLTSGPYSGQVLAQDHGNTWIRFDLPDPPTDPISFDIFASKHPQYSSGLYAWGLATDAVNGVFAYTCPDDDHGNGPPMDWVQFCDQDDGSYIGHIATGATQCNTQLDFDEWGNLWLVICDGYHPSSVFTLQRWDYDSGEPAPHYVKVDEWNITGQIPGNRVICDVIPLQRYRRVFVACNDHLYPFGMEIHGWDFSSGGFSYLGMAHWEVTDFNAQFTYPDCHLRLCDVKVDRSDDVLAGCRITAMWQQRPVFNRTLEIKKLNVDLNVVAQASLEYVYPCQPTYPGEFSNWVLDSAHGGRIVATYHRFTSCPDPPRMLVTDIPVDW